MVLKGGIPDEIEDFRHQGVGDAFDLILAWVGPFVFSGGAYGVVVREVGKEQGHDGDLNALRKGSDRDFSARDHARSGARKRR